MRNLSFREVVDILQWYEQNKNVNWGTWGNYPIDGASFLSYDTNLVVIKFDERTTFGGETFDYICTKRAPYNRYISFYTLKNMIDRGVIE